MNALFKSKSFVLKFAFFLFTLKNNDEVNPRVFFSNIISNGREPVTYAAPVIPCVECFMQVALPPSPYCGVNINRKEWIKEEVKTFFLIYNF